MTILTKVVVENDNPKPYGGILVDWTFYQIVQPTGIKGQLKKDHQGRFKDGDYVYTSSIQSFSFDTETRKGEIRTVNSEYVLGEPKTGYDVEQAIKQFFPTDIQ